MSVVHADSGHGSPLVGLMRLTLVNYPEQVAAGIFLPACNMRCPFCYNWRLALSSVMGEGLDREDGYVSLQEALDFLDVRQSLLGGLVVSGGEPLLSPFLPVIIRFAKGRGYRVKVDTNGQEPDALRELLADGSLCPDFVSLDVKCLPQDYGRLGGDGARLLSSMRILRGQGRAAVEYRTPLTPSFVTGDTIRQLAGLVPSDAMWSFSPFRGGDCLDPAFNDKLPPLSVEEAVRIASDAGHVFPS